MSTKWKNVRIFHHMASFISFGFIKLIGIWFNYQVTGKAQFGCDLNWAFYTLICGPLSI